MVTRRWRDGWLSPEKQWCVGILRVCVELRHSADAAESGPEHIVGSTFSLGADSLESSPELRCQTLTRP